jgi:hypothetical protein
MASTVNLQSLRSAVSGRQQAILDEVWEHIKQRQLGIPERPLLDKYGKAVLIKELGALGGTVIYTGHEQNKLRYNLGLVGVFLTSEGEHLDAVVERYLVALRDAYARDKEIEQFSSKDLASWAPNLSGDDIAALRQILERAHNSLASRYSGHTPPNWLATVENEVVELKHITDWKGYIHSRIMEWYDPRRPIGEVERMNYAVAQERPGPLAELLGRPGMERVGNVARPASDRAPNSEGRSNLHPWPVVRGLLLELDSYEVPRVVDRAGLVVDWRLSENEDYSHKTRLAAYRPRIDSAFQALPNDEDRLRVTYIVARELSKAVPAEKLNEALRDIRWELHETRLAPADVAVSELFFGEGSQHDAYVQIRAILQRASTSITIVDPYVDQSILTTLATCAKPRMVMELLTSRLPSDFELEVRKWLAQHQDLKLQVRTTKEFHDRFIVLDRARCWHIGASIKDAGIKAFMLSQIEDPANLTALLEQLRTSWQAATPMT